MRHLKEIILRQRYAFQGAGRLLFLAIDEILRGTNTKERIATSKAVLEYTFECEEKGDITYNQKLQNFADF